jgi:hypothetical protein
MANTRGKSLPQEGERRLVESLRAARLRLFDTPTADILRRLFGERRLVNGAKPFTCSNSQYFGYRWRISRRPLGWLTTCSVPTVRFAFGKPLPEDPTRPTSTADKQKGIDLYGVASRNIRIAGMARS